MTETQDSPRKSGTSKRGFASMDPERQREIARKGGASVPAGKRTFSTDRDLAARAGKKGGEAHRPNPSKELPERPRPQREFV
ncbi:MAG TPA: general stress protein [Candidatus Paceibacterota bacterium]